MRVGLTVCEDIWVPGPPESDEATAGATLIVNASSSPYFAGKGRQREAMVVQRARDNLCAFAFCNMVGGQDELIFDGHSLLVDHEGVVLARAPQFAEALVVASVDLQSASTARLRETRLRPPARSALPEVRNVGRFDRRGRPVHEHPADFVGGHRLGGEVAELLDPVSEVYEALVLGVHDYVEKNGFGHVCLGLSGGIDSTLVALVAVDALGPDRCTFVTMPSRYSSEGTRSDAKVLADNLGVALHRDPDRAGDGGLRQDARRRRSRAASPTSRRRTSRRASAATC